MVSKFGLEVAERLRFFAGWKSEFCDSQIQSCV
jgi:hypothetical protein